MVELELDSIETSDMEGQKGPRIRRGRLQSRQER